MFSRTLWAQITLKALTYLIIYFFIYQVQSFNIATLCYAPFDVIIRSPLSLITTMCYSEIMMQIFFSGAFWLTICMIIQGANLWLTFWKTCLYSVSLRFTLEKEWIIIKLEKIDEHTCILIYYWLLIIVVLNYTSRFRAIIMRL